MLKNQKKILIADDDELLLRSLVHKIVLKGFTPLQARNGKEAYAIALKQHPDLILLDILMPIVDGITTLKKLRANVWGEKVPVILLANLDHEDSILQKIMTETPTYYFTKYKLNFDDLINKIENELKV